MTTPEAGAPIVCEYCKRSPCGAKLNRHDLKELRICRHATRLERDFLLNRVSRLESALKQPEAAKAAEGEAKRKPCPKCGAVDDQCGALGCLTKEEQAELQPPAGSKDSGPVSSQSSPADQRTHDVAPVVENTGRLHAGGGGERVTHEVARGIVDRLQRGIGHGGDGVPGLWLDLLRYVDQQEQSEREAAALRAELELITKRRAAEQHALRRRLADQKTSLRQIHRAHDCRALECAAYQRERNSLNEALGFVKGHSNSDLVGAIGALRAEVAELRHKNVGLLTVLKLAEFKATAAYETMRDVGKGRERFTEQAQHEYALLAKERDSAQAEVAELKAERGKLNSDLRTLAADIRRIPSFDRSLAADIVLQRLDKPDAQSTQSGTQSNAIEPPSGRPGRDRPVTVEELAAVLRSFSKEFGEGTHVIGDGLVWLADELEGKAGK